MLTHTLQHPDTDIRKISQDILFDFYRKDGFPKIRDLLSSLHPTIVQTLNKAIPEASQIKGSQDELQADWT